MKLTLDSNEPLEDAIRVVGALYGVTLVASRENPDANKSAKKSAATPAKKIASKPTRSKNAVKRAPSAAVKTKSPAPSGKSATKDPVKKTAPRAAGSPGNAELRSWARQNGFTVSDRGRLPASVVTAYRKALHA